MPPRGPQGADPRARKTVTRRIYEYFQQGGSRGGSGSSDGNNLRTFGCASQRSGRSGGLSRNHECRPRGPGVGGAQGRGALKMKTVTWFGIGAVLVCTSCLGQPDDIGHVNSSISVDSNQEAGDLSDVNGAIRVGDHCTVRRSSTVNGGITIGSDSQTGSLSSVNGDLAIGSRTHVSGNAWTVNGHVDMSEAADVSGSLGNVNGSIHLAAAHVGNGISTVWGDIEIGKDSRVDN